MRPVGLVCFSFVGCLLCIFVFFGMVFFLWIVTWELMVCGLGLFVCFLGFVMIWFCLYVVWSLDVVVFFFVWFYCFLL